MFAFQDGPKIAYGLGRGEETMELDQPDLAMVFFGL